MEREDKQIQLERPNMVCQALDILFTKGGKIPESVAEDLGWSLPLLEEIVGSRLTSPDQPSAAVVSLAAFRKRV